MKSYLKRILSATSILVLLSACTGGPSASKPQKVDKTLQQVSLNGYLSDMTCAAFEWKPITDSRVEGIIVYRNDPDSQKPNELQETDRIKSARITHYLDEDLKPGTLYHYRFATYNAFGEISIASEQSDVRTMPLLPSVSFFSTAEAMPRSAKLVWRPPHTDNSVVAYSLERRQGGAEKWRKIATIKGRLNAEYIDEGLKDNTRYEYRLRSITYDGILSNPSDSAAVITKAPPKPVSTINASQGKAGSIEIDWQVEAEAKVPYYRLYRASSSTGRYKMIADKLTATHYSDKVKEPGTKYFYKVAGVSEDGLESEIDAVQAVMGTTLDAPNAPTGLNAMVENETVQLTWTPGDSRTLSYIVIKKTKKGLLSSETQEFKNIKKALIIDSSLQHGEEYTFTVIGVDKNGIKSEPSASVQVKLKDK